MLGLHATHTAFRGLPDVEVVGHVDANTDDIERKLSFTQAKHHYLTIEDMLGNESPDIVVLCSRHPYDHLDQIKAVAEKGCHIYCEKPISVALPEADEIVGDAGSSVDLNVHFTPEAHYRPTVPIDAAAEFHVWAMEWQEGQIDWYLDGEVIQTYHGPTPQEKMFILMALFQYSGWIGNLDPNLTYPRDFEVDYVRVHARDAG